jgi:hypothetical protein
MTAPLLQRYLRLLLTAGLPPAAVIAASVHFTNRLSILELAATALSGAAVIALALTVVAHAHATRVRRRGATIGFLLVMMPVIGVAITHALIVSSFQKPRGQWEALPPPPERLQHLAGPDCSHDWKPLLYARSRSGRLYQISMAPGVRHVLLDNGSVRRWRSIHCVHSGALLLPLAQFMGLVGAFAGGLIIAFAKPPLGWPRTSRGFS